jgi:hypothetical protein
VEELTDRSVAFFVGRELLEPGPFRLGLVRDGEIVDLDPEDRLREGVVDGDVLSARGVTARRDGHYVHIRAHEVDEEGILVLDAGKYDDEPVGVFVADNAVAYCPEASGRPACAKANTRYSIGRSLACAAPSITTPILRTSRTAGTAIADASGLRVWSSISCGGSPRERHHPELSAPRRRPRDGTRWRR